MADTDQTEGVSTDERVNDVARPSWARRCFDSQPIWLWVALGALAAFGLVGILAAPGDGAESADERSDTSTEVDEDEQEAAAEQSAGEGAADQIVASASPAPEQVATTTAVTSVPTTIAVSARTVVAESRREPCRYGADCLIVGFTISGFDETPGEFTCEFSDGSRYTFSLSGSSIETACMTADQPDSITIEVDGVRSETLATS